MALNVMKLRRARALLTRLMITPAIGLAKLAADMYANIHIYGTVLKVGNAGYPAILLFPTFVTFP